MTKRNIATSHRRGIKANNENLGSFKMKSHRESIVVPKTKKRNGVVVKIKPIIKKVGRNYIEMYKINDLEPVVFNASPNLKIYRISPGMLRFAKFLKRTPIAGLRRMGYDIIDI